MMVKFSARWKKLDSFDVERPFNLRLVVKTYSDNLSKSFIDYDVACNDKTDFKFPVGAIIILFLEQDYKLLTTVRRYTPQKMDYYKSLEGSLITVEKVKSKDAV